MGLWNGNSGMGMRIVNRNEDNGMGLRIVIWE